MSRLALTAMQEQMENYSPFPVFGQVSNVSGLLVEGFAQGASVGSIFEVYSLDKSASFLAEAVGFKGDRVLLMALGELRGVGLGSLIRFKQKSATIKIDNSMIGRVIDGLGRPLDDKGPLDCQLEYSIYSSPINPLKRARIHEPLDLGVKAINGLLTVGKGQRVGIMSGSGVGKSVLLGMLARNTTADVNVIGLIGERGREVRQFIERDLGPEGMARSVVVVATSDTSPVIRMRAAFVTATLAEYFRKQGADVLCMMDSVTRFAMAQREIGLSAGEPPTTKGYPPSVFSSLPKLFERAGNTSSAGSITGIYTVLIEADDVNDPIGDAVRSIVDGHIVLSRKLAARNHFPAIDVPGSASRVMSDVTSPEQRELAARLKSVLAYYAEAEDLINIGAYVKGSNPQIDEAILYVDGIKNFLKQKASDRVDFQTTIQQMKAIFAKGAPSGGAR